MPDIVKFFRAKVLQDMERFKLDDITLLLAAIVHPGYNSLDWVSSSKRKETIRVSLKEMATNAGLQPSMTSFDWGLFELSNIRAELPRLSRGAKIAKYQRNELDDMNDEDAEEVDSEDSEEV